MSTNLDKIKRLFSCNIYGLKTWEKFLRQSFFELLVEYIFYGKLEGESYVISRYIR